MAEKLAPWPMGKIHRSATDDDKKVSRISTVMSLFARSSFVYNGRIKYMHARTHIYYIYL